MTELDTTNITADAPETPAPVASTRTKPWTRTETPDFEYPDLTDEGWIIAYSRKRTRVAIYRKADRGGWLILDTRTGERYETANTHDGRMITNRLTAEHNAETARLRDEAAAARKALAAAKKAAKAAEKAAAAAEPQVEAEAA